MALITNILSGKDGYVRKVEVKTTDQGNAKTVLRPPAEVILFLHVG